MNLITTQNNDCLAASFAMACNCTLESFLKLLPKNKVQWPDLPISKCQRSWHYQECMLAAYQLGFGSMPMEKQITLGHDETHCIDLIHQLDSFITRESGVLILNNHSVAFSYGAIFDPKGRIYRFTNQEYKIIIPIFDLI